MAFFPDDAAELDDMSTEASLSRLYGGIHYRFDMEAGIALGRAVAGARPRGKSRRGGGAAVR